jgi:starch-binding outer membrane protein, SusD/RagB family
MKRYNFRFNIIIAILVSLFLPQCELEEMPKSEIAKESIFNTESGLELYAYSFYGVLPSAYEIHHGDAMSDYIVRNSIPDILTNGYSSNQSSGWDWGELRNINYFIENCVSPDLPSEVNEHYIGLARFFRAWFYFDKVKRFGDVPWIDYLPEVDDEILYGERDDRAFVMEKVLEDIDYACAHISMENDPTTSLVTKWVAYAFKSRICLFEGTFRKYRTEFGLESSANAWLQEAENAAAEVMTNSGFDIYTASGAENSYRDLFTSTQPVSSEVMLALVMSQELAELHEANWRWTSPTYGVKANFNRYFVNTYLMLDGTPFTDVAGYETMEFADEVKNRDFRLKQSIRLGDYTRVDGGVEVPAPPDWGYTLTGYMPIKWSLDDTYYDLRDYNDNSLSVIRYAEVLLNYAEAKAELGTLTDGDWANTVGKLRARAGISGGLSSKPVTVDAYMQTNYFPDVADAALMEIRRERGIELCCEGLRWADLCRWDHGDLVTQKWRGIYVPALDVPMDLNEDGIDDVIFVETTPNPLPEVSYQFVNVGEYLGETLNPQRLSEGTYGDLIWMDTYERIWNDKMYLYPVPEEDIFVNPALGQNPGW